MKPSFIPYYCNGLLNVIIHFVCGRQGTYLQRLQSLFSSRLLVSFTVFLMHTVYGIVEMINRQPLRVISFQAFYLFSILFQREVTQALTSLRGLPVARHRSFYANVIYGNEKGLISFLMTLYEKWY